MRPPTLAAATGVALLGAFALCLTSSPARAATPPDPLGSGTTTLSLSAPFKRLLAAHGVSLSATAPASGRAGSFALPLAEGDVNPIASTLSLESQGSLSFTRGHRRVIFRRLSVATGPTPLIAKVGGGQLKIATSARRSFARAGFGSTFAARNLRLTTKLATRLDKKLRLPDVFEQGQVLGALRATVQPATVAILPQGRLTLTPDPAFIAKLDSLFVSLNPIAPAERAPGGLFSVPFIPAGTIAPDGGGGVPRSGGSLEFLQLGAGQIFWHELWFDLSGHRVLAEVDIEPTPTFPGRLGQIEIAGFGGGTVENDPQARTIAISGAPLTLGAQMASAFNEAFARPQSKANVFIPGEALGTITFTASAR